MMLLIAGFAFYWLEYRPSEIRKQWKNKSMTLAELKTAISKFREKVQAYRDLMSESRDSIIPEIVRNGRQIAQMRSGLNAEHGRLEKYITKFGNNPRMNDGVNPYIYPVYSNAFSDDVLIRVGPSTDAVLQDLNYLTGKLNGLTEDEFAEALRPPEQENPQTAPSKNYWHMTNPFWWLWKFIKLIWQHKLISTTITAVGLLTIDYSLAWRNGIWIKNFILSLFY